ncbi:MAG: hypothetical protein AB7F19_04055 [Candidatus Babeliales bacterium]
MDVKKHLTLSWANPRTAQHNAHQHPTITQLQKDVLFTRQGVEQARKCMEQRAASDSTIEALDLASGRTRRQHALKVTALLNSKRKEDPRGFLLQESLCNPQALSDWHATLVEEPSLFRAEWGLAQDRHYAQVMLAATRVASHLKNIFLQNDKLSREIASNISGAQCSTDGRYLAGKRGNNHGVIIDIATQEVVHTTSLLMPWEPVVFSADSQFCMLPLAAYKTGYSHNFCKVTTQAFNLVTKQVVRAPHDVTDVELPVDYFSPSLRFGVLKPKATTSPHIGLYDTHSQKILVPFPEAKGWDSKTAISPNEKYFLLPCKDELRLYDLEAGGQPINNFALASSDPRWRDLPWAADSSCCVIPTNVEDRTATYNVYYPADNSTMCLGQISHSPRPSISPDGRYCYTYKDPNIGCLYDLRKRTKIREFELVRGNRECECPESAFFSEDPEYPYCIIPALSLEEIDGKQVTCARIIVFDLATQTVVEQVSNLKYVFFGKWQKRGPYYALSYLKPVPENHPSNMHHSLEIRDKRTHAVVLHVDNGRAAQSTPDSKYLRVHDDDDGAFLIDMVTESMVRKFTNQWQALANGSIIEYANQAAYEVAPPNCNWNNITSQQICLILYALMRYHEKKPLNLTDPSSKPLKFIFDSLDEYMQEYVARACNITLE